MANMLSKRLIIMAVLIVPASVLTGSVFFFTGSYFIDAILPVSQRIITFIHPEYVFKEFRLSKQAQPSAIIFFVTVRKPGSGVFSNNIVEFPVSGGLLDGETYVIPIITLSLLFSWPFLGIRKKLAAILLSLPLLFFAELFYISLYFIGYIDVLSRSIIYMSVTDTFSHHIFTFFVSFFITGGKQFLAILVFLFAIAPFHLKAGKWNNEKVNKREIN